MAGNTRLATRSTASDRQNPAPRSRTWWLRWVVYALVLLGLNYAIVAATLYDTQSQTHRITFNDVAGIDDAKGELRSSTF
jgi:hypothetical protein